MRASSKRPLRSRALQMESTTRCLLRQICPIDIASCFVFMSRLSSSGKNSISSSPSQCSLCVQFFSFDASANDANSLEARAVSAPRGPTTVLFIRMMNSQLRKGASCWVAEGARASASRGKLERLLVLQIRELSAMM